MQQCQYILYSFQIICAYFELAVAPYYGHTSHTTLIIHSHSHSGNIHSRDDLTIAIFLSYLLNKFTFIHSVLHNFDELYVKLLIDKFIFQSLNMVVL